MMSSILMDSHVSATPIPLWCCWIQSFSAGFIFRFRFSVFSPAQIKALLRFFFEHKFFPCCVRSSAGPASLGFLCWPAARSCAWPVRKDCVVHALPEEHSQIRPPRACAQGQVPFSCSVSLVFLPQTSDFC
jgi:hypothetical protein